MAEIARAVRWETTGGELQALVERRGVRLYVAMLAVLSLLGWAVPLTDHVGYELSELIALGAGAFGVAWAPGAAQAIPEGFAFRRLARRHQGRGHRGPGGPERERTRARGRR